MSDKKLTNIKKPQVFFCKSCVYPSSYPSILSFDENGVCSGCTVSSERFEINFDERLKKLKKIIDELKDKGNSHYDCIIPVSGGKDSFFQAHIIKELGLKALLVTYNGNNFSRTGEKNVQIMREVFGFDHIFYTPAVNTLKKLNRLGMLVMGDMNWHNHMGILTYPIKVAVEKNIPLMIWGEHGKADAGGMFSHDDFIEFNYRERLEHAGRGYEWDKMVELSAKYNENISSREMYPWKYPTDEEIDRVGVRGLWLDRFIYWESNDHLKLMKQKYGFLEEKIPFERTYRLGSNLDDIYENGVHDYMKFIKFGFGRASDHSCKDIRAKVMTRNKGIEEVKKRDHIKSKDLKIWLKYVGWSEKKFDEVADTFRDPRVWWIKDGKWMKVNIWGKESSYGKVLLPKNKWSQFFVE